MAINLRKILFVDEFLQSCRAIGRDKWRYLFLFFQFVIFADMWKYCRDDTVMVLNCVLSGALAMSQGVEWKKIFWVMLVYALMIVIPIWMYGIDELMFRQYVGYAIRILTGCFIASYFRRDFISKYENLVFVLAYISIPLFVVQIINPNIYDVALPLTKILFNFEYRSSAHRYLIIYVVNGWGLKRNSGFMWEPGAYAMMLSWAMLFLLYETRFQWNRRMIVYGIAMLTTFSLMGYPSMVLLILMFLAQKSDWKKIGYTMVGGGLLLLLLMQTPLFQEQRDMMANKVEFYANDSQIQLYRARNRYVIEEQSTKGVGRLAQFYILGDIISENPFGHGMSDWRYESANGLMNVIVKWGINAIIILAFSFYFFTKRLAQMAQLQIKWYIILMTMAVLIMPAISNPIYNAVFFLTLITFPLFAKRQQIPNIYAR